MLLRQRRQPVADVMELLNFPQFELDSEEATRLATADGFPDPSTVPDEPKVEDEVAEFLKDRGGRPLSSQ